ncbi:MAG: hypothetical protein ABIR34_13590 [Marmoricola sp.]
MEEKATHTGEASQPPGHLPVSTAHPDLRYELVAELVANPSEADPIASIRAAPSPAEASATGDLGPVYRRVPGGEMVVPTGRVLVRFTEGDAATDHQDDLRTLGYVVEQVLPYATHTAWVRAATGDIAAALRDLDQLSKLPGVVALEPQMIGSSAKRA